MDFYSKLRPEASEQRLVMMGRLATTVMVVIGLLWIPVIQGSRGLYDYLQGVQSYLAPPIFVVFFFGVFNKRLNKQGCLAALTVGLALGLFRLAVDTPVILFDDFNYAEGSFLWIVNNIFFQYYSLFIFLTCIVIMFAASYMTDPPEYRKISGLTYGTLTEEDRRESRASWTWTDAALSALLLIVIGAIYLYFTG